MSENGLRGFQRFLRSLGPARQAVPADAALRLPGVRVVGADARRAGETVKPQAAPGNAGAGAPLRTRRPRFVF